MTTYKEVQHFMNINGFTDLNGHKLLEDNKPGPLSKSAIAKFQKKAKTLGLYPENYLENGIPGPATLKAMGNYNKPVPTPKPACMTSPRWLDDADLKQNTNYYCACNSSQQALYELFGIRVPESELAKYEHTTTNGTGPAELKAGIIADALAHGKKITVEFKNFSDVGWQKVGEMVQDPNIALFFHEMYRRKWGHYEYPYAVCMDSKIVKMANSLSGGYLENRAFSEQEAYMNLLNQPSIVIVRKV